MKSDNAIRNSTSIFVGIIVAIAAFVRGALLLPLLLVACSIWGLYVLQHLRGSLTAVPKKKAKAPRRAKFVVPDIEDTLLAGLLCALCFSGLFAMERKGGMDEILASTPLGRKYTVKAKLWQSTAVAAVIAFGTVLPHLWQVLRDYGLHSLLGPAMSISDLQAVPKFITLSDLLIFWLICRFAACLCMSRITLWLGQKLGNLLTALFISAVAYCLPALLSLSGMKNGIEWLGFYPLFHAAALWQNQGYNANGESYNAMWIPIFLVCTAFFLAWAIGQALIDDYDMIGVPDEVL